MNKNPINNPNNPSIEDNIDGVPINLEEDIDGVPLEEDIDGVPFVPQQNYYAPPIKINLEKTRSVPKLPNLSMDKMKMWLHGDIVKNAQVQQKKIEKETKEKQDEEDTAKVYAEFASTFLDEDPNPVSKTFVRGGTFVQNDQNTGQSISIPNQKGQIYQPKPLWGSFQKNIPKTNTNPEIKINQPPKKKKKNIDSFLEELKKEHDARSTEHARHGPSQPLRNSNIFVTNLDPLISEEMLLKEFSQFGPIGSVKILYNRSDDSQRTTNSGFVCFMNRKDADECIGKCQNAHFGRRRVRVNWGTSVTMPTQPLNVPPDTPNPTIIKHSDNININFPDDDIQREIIDVVSQYIAMDGSKLENLLLQTKSVKDQYFSFLFDYDSPLHIYYRWRVYSLCQGDSLTSWVREPFQLTKDGPYWIPPLYPKLTFDVSYRKKTDHHHHIHSKPTESTTITLLPEESKAWLTMLQQLSGSREEIKIAMVFAINHSDAADEVSDILIESLTLEETPLIKKMARLYLLSDILYNSSVKVKNATRYRTIIQNKLPSVFEQLSKHYLNMGRLTAETLKDKVLNLISIWNNWSLYPAFFLNQIQEIFLNKTENK